MNFEIKTKSKKKKRSKNKKQKQELKPIQNENIKIVNLIEKLSSLGIDISSEVLVACKYGHKYSTTKELAAIDNCPLCAKWTKEYVAKMIKIRRNHNILFKNDKDEKLSPCCVYFVKFKNLERNPEESFYKIGITKDSPLKRLNKVPYNIEVLGCIFTNRAIAIMAERILHRKHDEFSYQPLIGFSGISECFKKLIKPEIKKFADNQDKYIEDFFKD